MTNCKVCNAESLTEICGGERCDTATTMSDQMLERLQELTQDQMTGFSTFFYTIAETIVNNNVNLRMVTDPIEVIQYCECVGGPRVSSIRSDGVCFICSLPTRDVP